MARGAKQAVKCKCCKVEFQARVADIKRGWGKFCSKSCKATYQEVKTGQFKDYLRNQDDDFSSCGNMMTSGYFGHGQN